MYILTFTHISNLLKIKKIKKATLVSLQKSLLK